jgi:hypothetical protein
MLNVSRIINSPRIAQPSAFTVTRSTGTWVNGRFTLTTSTLNYSGTILPASSKDVIQTPEGDRIKGEIAIYTDSNCPLYETFLNQKTGNSGNVSDEVTWQGENYKIIQVKPYVDYGYYKAIAVRKRGA